MVVGHVKVLLKALLEKAMEVLVRFSRLPVAVLVLVVALAPNLLVIVDSFAISSISRCFLIIILTNF